MCTHTTWRKCKTHSQSLSPSIKIMFLDFFIWHHVIFSFVLPNQNLDSFRQDVTNLVNIFYECLLKIVLGTCISTLDMLDASVFITKSNQNHTFDILISHIIFCVLLFSDSGTKSIFTSVGTHMLLVITIHLLMKVLWNISYKNEVEATDWVS